MRDCLSCKYEPDWGEKTGIENPRRSGKCKWDGDIPKLPAVYSLTVSHIIVYSDNSGVYRHCKTWEPKPKVDS